MWARPLRNCWPERLAALSAAALLAWAPQAHARGYTPQGSCGGHERVCISSPAGTCVALVADERDGLRAPRRVLEVNPGRLWIIDMGSWVPHQGRLLEVTLPVQPAATPRQRPQIKMLADKLDRPLALVRGPDAQIYIGEAGRIWRTPVPVAGQPIQPQTVLDALPNDGAHPLKEITFGPDGSLYINMGSVTDRCQGVQGELPYPCPEREAMQFRGAVWRAVLVLQTPATPKQPPVQQFAPFALGLRNSVALATLPDGPAGFDTFRGGLCLLLHPRITRKACAAGGFQVVVLAVFVAPFNKDVVGGSGSGHVQANLLPQDHEQQGHGDAVAFFRGEVGGQ